MGPMGRRRFLAGMGALLAAPIAGAQPAGKVYRVGYLMSQAQPRSATQVALVQALGELGYAEGRNLVFERHHAHGTAERLPEAARALAASKPDVIVTSVNAFTRAAQRATQTIPIVMVVGTDVVEEGFVASLSRPGSNITGLTWDVGVELMAKRFEHLKEALPGLSRVAVLWDPGQDARSFRSIITQGAEALGVKLIWIELTTKRSADFAAELEQAFATARRGGAQAIFTGGGARLFRNRKRVVELAAEHRLPDTHYSGEFVEAGGLMAYAPNLPEMFKRAARYVDKILRGAAPADLPVEQPTRIDLLINLKTAKALGLSLPRSLLLRADRLIE